MLTHINNNDINSQSNRATNEIHRITHLNEEQRKIGRTNDKKCSSNYGASIDWLQSPSPVSQIAVMQRPKLVKREGKADNFFGFYELRVFDQTKKKVKRNIGDFY